MLFFGIIIDLYPILESGVSIRHIPYGGTLYVLSPGNSSADPTGYCAVREGKQVTFGFTIEEGKFTVINLSSCTSYTAYNPTGSAMKAIRDDQSFSSTTKVSGPDFFCHNHDSVLEFQLKISADEFVDVDEEEIEEEEGGGGGDDYCGGDDETLVQSSQSSSSEISWNVEKDLYLFECIADNQDALKVLENKAMKLVFSRTDAKCNAIYDNIGHLLSLKFNIVNIPTANAVRTRFCKIRAKYDSMFTTETSEINTIITSLRIDLHKLRSTKDTSSKKIVNQSTFKALLKDMDTDEKLNTIHVILDSLIDDENDENEENGEDQDKCKNAPHVKDILTMIKSLIHILQRHKSARFPSFFVVFLQEQLAKVIDRTTPYGDVTLSFFQTLKNPTFSVSYNTIFLPFHLKGPCKDMIQSSLLQESHISLDCIILINNWAHLCVTCLMEGWLLWHGMKGNWQWGYTMSQRKTCCTMSLQINA